MYRRRRRWRQSPICGDAVDVFQQKGPGSARESERCAIRTERIDIVGDVVVLLELVDDFAGLQKMRGCQCLPQSRLATSI